jgi:hypothetical protein
MSASHSILGRKPRRKSGLKSASLRASFTLESLSGKLLVVQPLAWHARRLWVMSRTMTARREGRAGPFSARASWTVRAELNSSIGVASGTELREPFVAVAPRSMTKMVWLLFQRFPLARVTHGLHCLIIHGLEQLNRGLLTPLGNPP